MPLPFIKKEASHIVSKTSTLEIKIMEYVNLTPHSIHLNDGRVFEPCGEIARVTASFTDIKDDVCEQVFGEVQNLPDAKPDTMYIVSGMVLAACKHRKDVVAPATGHPDTVRNGQGQISSVPCFTR